MAVCGPYILAEREMMSQVCDHAAVSHPAPACHFHFQLLQLVIYAILRPNSVFSCFFLLKDAHLCIITVSPYMLISLFRFCFFLVWKRKAGIYRQKERQRNKKAEWRNEETMLRKKGKGKTVSVYTMTAFAEVESYLHPFIISAQNMDEWCQLHNPSTLLVVKETPAASGQKSGWVPHLILWRRGQSLACMGKWNTIPLQSSL